MKIRKSIVVFGLLWILTLFASNLMKTDQLFKVIIISSHMLMMLWFVLEHYEKKVEYIKLQLVEE